MKILVLGVGKSGTTALLHKIAASIPNCRTYAGGNPGEHLRYSKNAVFKHTYNEAKGRAGELYREHLQTTEYDKKIWIVRDPRDSAVSEFLYRWYAGLKKDLRQREAALALVRRKERDPRSVAFHQLYCLSGTGDRPDTLEEMTSSLRGRQQRLTEFVTDLGKDWFVFRYEDMIDGHLESLSDHLGVTVAGDAEVPKNQRRIARRKSYGDWRHWFTDADCEIFRPLYSAYMKQTGYDSDDWSLSPEPHIDPRFASEYIERISRKDPLDQLRRLRKRVGKSIRRRLPSRHP